MSRWIQMFEAHPFQITWNALKVALEATTIDDETVITSVSELARLNKVISYLDEMILSLDPELVPMPTWDTFNSQATPCLQSIQSYLNDRTIAHITQANAHADNLLTYIRPYMVPTGEAGKILATAIKAYSKTIEEYAESFRNKSSGLIEEISLHSDQSKELLTSIESIEQQASMFGSSLFGSGEPDSGIQNKVNDLVDDFEKKNQEIVDLYNETFVGEVDTPSTKKDIALAKKEAQENKEKILLLLEDVEPEVNDLKKFHTRIFGVKHDDDEVEDGGLAGELNVRIKALGDFETHQKTKYAALNNQIESLLPGATSAGLASAYLEMKESFNRPIKSMSAVFYTAIGLLVSASIILTIDSVGLDYIKFVKIGEWDEVLKSVVNKIPFYAPILWLAFYASKRRSEYQRLQQEYAHKEAFAKSYDNYKKQIEQLDVKDLEMQKQLISKAVDAIAYNASATLDGKHGDKMPTLSIIEKTVEKVLHAKKLFGQKNP